MNPGIPEEVAKVATTTVEALKATPVVLALVVFNVLFMILSGYVSLQITERWDAEITRWEKLVHSCQGIAPSPR